MRENGSQLKDAKNHPSQPALEFLGVSRTFRGTPPVLALDSISVQISSGEIFAVVGESGAGKSTFLALALGLQTPSEGTVRVLGNDLADLKPSQMRALRKNIGTVFQENDLLMNVSVKHNVELPSRLAKKNDPARAIQLLDFVGLADRATNHPAELSGGEKQRVQIARALMLNPKILLFDEPTSALDTRTRDEMVSLILETRREFGSTCVIVSHDLNAVKALSDRAAILENGRLVDTVAVKKTVTIDPQPETDYASKARRVLGA